MRRLDLYGWLYGLGNAVIGGGASAVTAGISIQLLDPVNDFHGWMLVKLMVTTFAVNAALNLFTYLKSKPLPPLVEIKRSVVDKSVFTDATGTQVERVQTMISTESKPDARKDERPLTPLPATPVAPVAVVVINKAENPVPTTEKP